MRRGKCEEAQRKSGEQMFTAPKFRSKCSVGPCVKGNNWKPYKRRTFIGGACLFSHVGAYMRRAAELNGKKSECIYSSVISSLLRIAGAECDKFWMESTCVSGPWQCKDMCSASGNDTPQNSLSTLSVPLLLMLSVSCSVSLHVLLYVCLQCRQVVYIKTTVYRQWRTVNIDSC